MYNIDLSASANIYAPEGGGETAPPVALQPSVTESPAPSQEETTTPLETAQPPATEGPLQSPSPPQEVPALMNTAMPDTQLMMEAPIATETAEEPRLYDGKDLLGAIGVTALIAVCLTTVLLGLARKKRRRKKKRKNACPATASRVSLSTAARPLELTIGNAHKVGRRENQQDAFGVSDVFDERQCQQRGVLAVVADGMGGLKRGEEISAAATAAMLHGFAEAPQGLLPSQTLLHLVNKANQDACMRINTPEEKCGTTLIAALIRGDRLFHISVGDSRIYLYRAGRLIQLTRPHVYGAELDEKAASGQLTFEEASQDAQRRGLTSYIGMGTLEKVDYNQSPIFLMSGDRVLLMTDGVFGTLSNDEITAAVLPDPQETAEAIERAIEEKNDPYQDNYTVIVLQFS